MVTTISLIYKWAEEMIALHSQEVAMAELEPSTCGSNCVCTEPLLYSVWDQEVPALYSASITHLFRHSCGLAPALPT